MIVPGVIDLFPFDIPSFCCYCSKPFPWTEKGIEIFSAFIKEFVCKTDDDRLKAIEWAKEIAMQSAYGELYVTKIKKMIKSCDEETQSDFQRIVAKTLPGQIRKAFATEGDRK